MMARVLPVLSVIRMTAVVGGVCIVVVPAMRVLRIVAHVRSPWKRAIVGCLVTPLTV